MNKMTFTHKRTRNGRWEGVLAGAIDTPVIHATCNGRSVDGVEISAIPAIPQDWSVIIPIPQFCLTDGVHTLVFTDANNGEQLGSYTLVLGQALEDDYRAELSLLRAELDMLKRAFRRHCLETG